MGGAGATLATVLWSDTSSYCAMSSVAAPPRHPAPSISNTRDVIVSGKSLPKQSLFRQPIPSKEEAIRSHDVLASTGIQIIPCSSRLFHSIGIGCCCPAARRRWEGHNTPDERRQYYWFFVNPSDELQRPAWGRTRFLPSRKFKSLWETGQRNGFSCRITLVVRFRIFVEWCWDY